jgi:acetyltransferase-like isoleucine patch superfamily enzyme
MKHQIDPSVRIFGGGQLHMADKIRIDAFVVIIANADLWIGPDVHISSHCSIRSHAGIRIGANTSVSAGCHLFGASDMPDGTVKSGEIIIGENCLIGAGSVVLPNTEICDNVTIGANSVAKGKIDQPGVWAGQPARHLSV